MHKTRDTQRTRSRVCSRARKATLTAAPSSAEKLGYQYYYDEEGNLLFEQGAGAAQSTGRTFYVYLPTPSGPMPISVFLDAKHYAVHTDHLNTPRRLTQSNKQVAWQWAFSAFGDEQPTTGKNCKWGQIKLNLSLGNYQTYAAPHIQSVN